MICWDFPIQPSLGFTLKGMKKSYYLVDKSLGLMGRKHKHWFLYTQSIQKCILEEERATAAEDHTQCHERTKVGQ